MGRHDGPDLAAGFTPEERAELGDLGPLAGHLARYDAPVPDAASQAALLARLRPMVAARTATPEAIDWGAPVGGGVRDWLRLALAQTRLIDPAFRWASALIVALGLLVGLSGRGGPLALVLALLAPILAAAGVAIAFRPAGQTLSEIERLSPVSPLSLLYARLAVVLAVNLGISAVLLLGIWAEEPRLVLWRLALLWLGPMLGLAGLSLWLSVRVGPLVSIAAPSVLWGGLVFGTWRWAEQVNRAVEHMDSLALLAWVSGTDGAFTVSLLFLVAGAALLWHASRLVRREVPVWS